MAKTTDGREIVTVPICGCGQQNTIGQCAHIDPRDYTEGKRVMATGRDNLNLIDEIAAQYHNEARSFATTAMRELAERLAQKFGSYPEDLDMFQGRGAADKILEWCGLAGKGAANGLRSEAQNRAKR